MSGSSDAAVIQEGMNIIGNQLLEALKSEGLEPVDVTGLFDPRVHEAVGEVETDEKEDDQVFDELSRGYKMIRVARNPRSRPRNA
jgi:molecular chaperone GrpE